MLAGTDGLIFVVDVQPHLLQDNIRSWTELKEFFSNKLGHSLLIVIMMNKCDLPNAITRQRLTNALNLNNGIHVFPTITTQDPNVSESFSAIIQQIFQ